jgi:16S rRNA (cytidine1402-2'-O)-methyltransferase
VLSTTKYFLAENIRSARRFISELALEISIEELQFRKLDKHTDPRDISDLITPIQSGFDIGIISESGLPCIADPGNLVVQYAHEHGIRVKTLAGASSIILGLISSGFDGQRFTFHGYLPIKDHDRIKRIREIEKELFKTGYTQIFMETPYRNQKMFTSLLHTLNRDTLLYVGSDISGKESNLKTMTVDRWKKSMVTLNKFPTIFAIGKY